MGVLKFITDTSCKGSATVFTVKTFDIYSEW